MLLEKSATSQCPNDSMSERHAKERKVKLSEVRSRLQFKQERDRESTNGQGTS